MRLVCTEQIEELEDQLPRVTNPQDREDRTKRIETLHEMADEINRRAEFLNRGSMIEKMKIDRRKIPKHLRYLSTKALGSSDLSA